MTPLVLKLGGELLETPAQRSNIAAFASATVQARPLVVIHGGGRAIDRELERRQIAPAKVDGLRITDAATLDVVVSVLAGSANTDLVAALVMADVKAVGLTGVDAGFGRATRVAAHQSTTGAVVDLGLVGDPVGADGSLIRLLIGHGYVPVVASIGLEDSEESYTGQPLSVLNVNADVMACRIAAALNGCDLVIAGGTAGVLDDRQRTIDRLDVDGINHVIASGTATAGMVAKLSAVAGALGAGVTSARIVDGRTLDAHHGVDEAPGTTLLPALEAKTGQGRS